ncbi:MAG: heme ABC transporter permease [Methylococcales bacterium]|jgi:heme exporter protein C|nr:heme ABC transporter permease [Methylococcales bacterium]MBT7409266.1 heme ABC transporter permease [Methylococcales bacterium]
MFERFHKYASPKYFYDLATLLIPYFFVISWVVLLTGIGWGLAFSPPDYQQGESVRIIYVHVPSAILSMSAYMFMAVSVFIAMVWRIKIAYMVARSCAPIGAVFTLIALVTGSLWGKPMWGAWWVWDARLTSELILFFIYLGIIALQQAIEDKDLGDRMSGIMVLVGVVNIPIIHYSVIWWNTLHQKATISKMGQPSIDSSMLWPLLLMILAHYLFFATYILMQTRNEVLNREKRKGWVKEVIV